MACAKYVFKRNGQVSNMSGPLMMFVGGVIAVGFGVCVAIFLNKIQY